MAEVEVIELEVFYDYFCPFVYRASVMFQRMHDSGERSLKIIGPKI